MTAADPQVAALDKPSAQPATRTWERTGLAATRALRWDERWHRVGFAWSASAPVVPRSLAATDPRLVTFHVLVDDLAAELVRAIAGEVGGAPMVALLASD